MPASTSKTELFNRVLKDFAEHFKLGEKKRVILPLDQAGWHIIEKLQVPDGIHLLLLPPFSRVATCRAALSVGE